MSETISNPLLLFNRQQESWRQGTRLLVEQLLSAEEQQQLSAETSLQLISAEIKLRQAAGQLPTLAEYAQRFPTLRTPLEQLWPTLPIASSNPQLADTITPASTAESAATVDFHSPPQPTPSQQATLQLPSSVSGHKRSISSASANTPTDFGEYELLGEIARGGMGVVYRAKQKRLNRIVALKMILAGSLASTTDIQRFYTEAEAAAQLEHAGIVPIYEIGELEGQHFFSMAFIDGQSLQAKLKNGPLSARETAELVSTVAEAVAYAHSKGVVHRDLKPHNILLDKANHPKITDFGLAKLLNSEDGLTMTGDVMGTPSYMAPEQAAGKLREIGPLVDVYALGAILYATLTGRPPFAAATLLETIRQVTEQPPVALRLLNPSIPKDLETICLKCLEKDPRRRYASANDVAADLRRFLQGEPILARRVSYAERAWRWCRRRPLLVGLATTVLVAVLLSIAAYRLAGDVRQQRELAKLQTKFGATLDTLAVSQDALEAAEGTVRELETKFPKTVTDHREKINRKFAGLLEATLEKSRLEAADIAQVRTGIELLKPRDAISAARLDKSLKSRLVSWNEVLHVQAPFAELDKAVGPTRFTLRDKTAIKAVVSNPSAGSAFVRSIVAAERRMEVQANFDPTWEEASQVGLSLDCHIKQGYAFVLRTTIPTGSELSEAAADNPVSPSATTNPVKPTFGQTRTAKRAVMAEIIRNGVSVAQQNIPLAAIPAGVLRLRAERLDDVLTFQIQDQPPLIFQDIFPLNPSQDQVGVILPQPAALTSLLVRRKDRPEVESSLEASDSMFSAGKFLEALAQFQQAETLAKTDSLRQECRFKGALCLVELNRTKDAAESLQSLLVDSGERWPQLAACHLWLLHLREKNYNAADVVFDQIAARFDLVQFVRLLPATLFDEIRGYYNSAGYRSFSPNASARLQPILKMSEALSGGKPEWGIRMNLLRAAWSEGQTSDALALGDILTQASINDENQNGLVHFAINYFWLLRVEAPHRVKTEQVDQLLATDENHLPEASRSLRLEKVRMLHSQHKLDEANRLIQDILTIPQVNFYGRNSTLEVYFVAGMLAEEQGDSVRAQELWHKGMDLFENAVRPQWANFVGISDFLFQAMASLTGRKADTRAAEYFQQTVATASLRLPITDIMNNPGLREAFISTPTIEKAFPQMFAGQDGRKLLEALAWQTIRPHELQLLQLHRLSTEIFVCDAFAIGVSPEQRSFINALIVEAQQLVFANKLSKKALIPCVFAWQGNAGLFGWQAAELMLNDMPELRNKIRFVVAHRLAQLGQPDPALVILRSIVAQAPADAEIRRLAAESLEMFTAGEGRLVVTNPTDTKVEFVIRGAQDISKTLEPGARELWKLPKGEYTILVLAGEEPPQEVTKVQIQPAGHREVTLPGPASSLVK